MKSYAKLAAVVLVTIAATAFLQRKVFAVPVVGDYLPK